MVISFWLYAFFHIYFKQNYFFIKVSITIQLSIPFFKQGNKLGICLTEMSTSSMQVNH